MDRDRIDAQSTVGVFDLDEDDTSDVAVIEAGRDEGIGEVTVFDLDEDAPLLIAAPDDSPAPTFTFDLDEEVGGEGRSMDAETGTDAALIAVDEAGLSAIAQAESEADAEAEAAAMAAAMIHLAEADGGDEDGGDEDGDDEDGDDGERSLWEAPDDVSTEDLREAQQDQRHTELMGQYMYSRGVTQ